MTIVNLPGGWVDLRAITGRDENQIAEADTSGTLIGALTLIDRLLVGRDGALIQPGEAARLTSAARDRLLCAIYQQIYGETILSSPACSACGEKFDLSFSLKDVLAQFPVMPVPPDGVYALPDGTAFRLPTGQDELAALGLSAAAARQRLMSACLSVHGRSVDAASLPSPAVEAIEAAMEAAAPLINLDLVAVCPECAAQQKIRFDIGAYLLGRLRADHARLTSEIHALALAYHWGLDEILSLSRAERGRFLALIEADAHRARLSAMTRGGARRRIS